MIEPQPKPCIKCKVVKPPSEYYSQEGKVDRLESTCKACKKAYMRGRKSKTAGSTQLGMLVLENQGWPSIKGGAAGMPYVDIAVWGCIPVEAKSSKPARRHSENGNIYQWCFSHKQRQYGIPGFLMVMAIAESGVRSFIIPGDAEWLFNANGSIKVKGLGITLGSAHGNSKNGKLLAPYENAFHLIEEAFQRHCQHLKDTTSLRSFLEGLM